MTGQSNAEKIGSFAMEAITDLEQRYPQATVDTVAIVVSLRGVLEDDHASTMVRYACTDERGYVQRGLLEEAVDAARFGIRETDDDED